MTTDDSQVRIPFATKPASAFTKEELDSLEARYDRLLAEVEGRQARKSDEKVKRADLVPHNVGRCPSCRQFLWAQVRVVTDLSAARLDGDGEPSAHTYSRCVGMTLTHSCGEES